MEKESQTQGFSEVKNVWLEIGDLAGVESEAMIFCFDAVTRHSIAEGATLHIINVPGRGICSRCGNEITLLQRFELCSECGSSKIKLTSGTEMRIKELEVI